MPVETEGLTEFRVHVAPPEPPLEYRYHTIFGATGAVRCIGEADEQTPSNITHTGYRNMGWTESSLFEINGREWCVVKDSEADVTLRRMCGKIVVHIQDEGNYE